MIFALLSALAIGEFFTALLITLFVLVAEVLEGLTMSRGRRAIKDLLDLLPHEVLVRRGSSTQEMSASAMRVGDIVIVRPGARLPVDGVVIRGVVLDKTGTLTFGDPEVVGVSPAAEVMPRKCSMLPAQPNGRQNIR